MRKNPALYLFSRCSLSKLENSRRLLWLINKDQSLEHLKLLHKLENFLSLLTFWIHFTFLGALATSWEAKYLKRKVDSSSTRWSIQEARETLGNTYGNWRRQQMRTSILTWISSCTTTFTAFAWVKLLLYLLGHQYLHLLWKRSMTYWSSRSLTKLILAS